MRLWQYFWAASTYKRPLVARIWVYPWYQLEKKVIENSRTFLFIDIYEYAALIDECLRDSGSFIELGFEESPELIERFVKPHKLSILHEYIFALICVEESRKFRKHSELFEKEDIERFEKTFEEYGVPFVPYESFDPNTDTFENEIDDKFYRWFLFLEQSFRMFWGKITDEVFHIIFSNRWFLCKFNGALAEYLEQMADTLPQEILSKEGRIRRCVRLPVWLKKAVFYRDHGRCVVCRKDLSGLLGYLFAPWRDD